MKLKVNVNSEMMVIVDEIITSRSRRRSFSDPEECISIESYTCEWENGKPFSAQDYEQYADEVEKGILELELQELAC